MSFRAKFYVSGVTPQPVGYEGSTLHLHTQYDDTIPEDQRFALATPSGSIQMLVTNPAVLEQVSPGKIFYVDFTEVTR